ncbi:hypothetical protein E1269_09680, partial [Jiangella asiatica]
MVSVGTGFSCGISAESAAFCWGTGSSGELGDGGETGARRVSPRPVVTPAGVEGWSTLTAGQFHACGVSTDGAAFCWGEDDFGQLGNGPGVTENQVSPSPVVTPAGVGGWSTLTAAANHTCGVSTDGAAFCWG